MFFNLKFLKINGYIKCSLVLLEGFYKNRYLKVEKGKEKLRRNSQLFGNNVQTL